jgi:hypothetical protein
MVLGLYVGVGFVLGFVVGVVLTVTFGSLMVDRTIQQRFDGWEDEHERKVIKRFFGFGESEDEREILQKPLKTSMREAFGSALAELAERKANKVK